MHQLNKVVKLDCTPIRWRPHQSDGDPKQSQQGVHQEPNAYRSMRDNIHPPRVGAPSCIIPPAEDVAMRPYLVPLLLTFHGMENENPYTHLGF